MELGTRTVHKDLEKGFAMEPLMRDYHVALFLVCLASLIVGIPLVWNMLWHLKVRTSCKKTYIP